MKSFLIALVGFSLVCCYGIEGALMKAHDWAQRSQQAAERAMAKIEAKRAPERERQRQLDAERPRFSDRKLVRRRRPEEARPVPMEERYEQR